ISSCDPFSVVGGRECTRRPHSRRLRPGPDAHSGPLGRRRPGLGCSFERMAFTVEDARGYIADVRWQFARTMPQWPHEYTVREWRPDLEQDFLEFVALIRRGGTVK